MTRSNVLRKFLCVFNPKINLCNGHYICGSNLSLFSSFAEIENCLTNTTCKIKNIKNNCCNRK